MATEVPQSPPSLRPRPTEPPFKVRVNLELDVDFSMTLANYILDSKCPNPALRAMAHRLIGREDKD